LEARRQEALGAADSIIRLGSADEPVSVPLLAPAPPLEPLPEPQAARLAARARINRSRLAMGRVLLR
jgi:hypothetical protein